MPEGDTILRAGRVLARALEGKVVLGFSSPLLALARAKLVGRVILAVETHGKNLLFRFDAGAALHSHMGMHGSWHIYRPGERWRKSEREAGCVIEVEGFVAICFSPQILRLLTPHEERRALGALGPDILAGHFDLDEARRRLRGLPDRAIGDAILAQSAVAGIGNVYKSEILFLTRTDPRILVADLSDAKIDAVVREAQKWMRLNTAPERGMRQTRTLGGPRHWVYGRSGSPCLGCGTTIAIIRQGKDRRSTYFCPRCQARDTEQQSR